MTKEMIRKIINIIIAVLLSVIAIKLFIWLLPIIITAILAYHIYKIIKKNEEDKIKRSKTSKKRKLLL